MSAAPERRRVVFVQSAPNGHHPRHHYRMAATLSEAGFDVTTLAPPARSDAAQRDAVPVELLPRRRNRFTRIASGPLTVWAAARRRPACVHVLSLDLLPWAVLLRALGRTRVLYDSNEQYDSMMLIKDWIPERVRPVLERTVHRLEPWLAARLDGATTALPGTQEKFERAGVRSVLVRNFPPKSLLELGDAPPERDVDVLLGGSMSLDQISILAETAHVVRRRLGRPARWLLAVRGFTGREQAMLERMLAEAGVREDFEVRFDVPFVEMPPLMRRARVGLVLYPTAVNYGDRIPLRVFDYMAAGLPFVASDLPTTAEYTRGFDVAELVPAGDPEAYGTALVDLLGDEERLERMRRRGPELAAERFTWEVEARKLVQLYEELLPNVRRSASAGDTGGIQPSMASARDGA